MLDLIYPQTQYVFRAAVLEDRIRSILRMRWFSDQELIDEETRVAICQILFELSKLNKEHFDGQVAIQRQLDALHQTILCRTELAVFSEQFVKFTSGPGDNFGTWAI
jgi:hypothetical protein